MYPIAIRLVHSESLLASSFGALRELDRGKGFELQAATQVLHYVLASSLEHSNFHPSSPLQLAAVCCDPP